MFGISHFTAIINPPQAAILAVGGSRLVLDPETASPVTKMSATLCYDERVVDDALAAEFMETFGEIMENPMLMLTQSKPVGLKSLFERPQ
jgi:pyruvate/2-oxoglutarate dehydrogenase complex dihydrolipoamide acyltransferase (E2) component